jgi:hypothetical protein
MASKNAAAASKALEKEFDFHPQIFANGNKGETANRKIKSSA